jgi:polysaccharide biosynthesis/export protein
MPNSASQTISIARPTTYLLRPSDLISVTVFREPDLSLPSVRLGVEGNVSVPMLGSIPAAGMTAKQLEQDVTRRFAAIGLKDPMVSVNITEYASHEVTVEGAVERPGVYKFQPGARLSSAVALASGPKRSAKLDQVAVFRESSGRHHGRQVRLCRSASGRHARPCAAAR